MSEVIKLKRSNKKLKVRLKTPFEEYLTEQDITEEVQQPELEEEVVPEVPEIDITEQLNEAYQRGFNEGAVAAQKELEPQYQALLAEEINKFNPILEEINSKFQEYDSVFDKIVLDLAFQIAEKVVEREVKIESNINSVLQSALKKVIGANNVLVKMSSVDLDNLNSESRKILNSDSFSNIKFEADPNLDPGGCFVETEIGNVDARLFTRFNEVKRLFEDNLESDK